MEELITAALRNPDTVLQNIVEAYKILQPNKTIAPYQKKKMILSAFDSILSSEFLTEDQRQVLLSVKPIIGDIIEFVHWNIKHNKIRRCCF